MVEISDRKQLKELFFKNGFTDFKWIDPQNIVVSLWVRIKCMFGCKEYGKNACCPPNTLPVQECKSFFSEYSEAVVFHFEKKFENPEQRHEWTKGINERLLSLEHKVFFAGNPKAFLLFMDSCNVCADCAEERVKCKNKGSARPTPEGMAVDVFSTVRALGYPITVLRAYSEAMNRYAFLLVG
jgi:predicted metal-binding protein